MHIRNQTTAWQFEIWQDCQCAVQNHLQSATKIICLHVVLDVLCSCHQKSADDMWYQSRSLRYLTAWEPITRLRSALAQRLAARIGKADCITQAGSINKFLAPVHTSQVQDHVLNGLGPIIKQTTSIKAHIWRSKHTTIQKTYKTFKKLHETIQIIQKYTKQHATAWSCRTWSCPAVVS